MYLNIKTCHKVVRNIQNCSFKKFIWENLNVYRYLYANITEWTIHCPIIGVKTNGYNMNGNLRARNENYGTPSI
jgi:hypothetical protein